MIDICVENLRTGRWEWFDLDKVGAEEIEKWLGNQEYELVDIEGGDTLYKELRYKSFEQIEHLNSLIRDEQHLQIALEVLSLGMVENLEEALNYEDYRVYENCKDMSDVAYEWLEETDGLHGMPEHLKNYFDYDLYGRDLEIEGNFVQLDYDTYLEIW